MENVLKALSASMGDAVARAGGSVVQVAGPGWRPVCGIVVASGRVLTIEEDGSYEGMTVRTGDGMTHAAVHGGVDPATGLALVRVEGLQAQPAGPAGEMPSPGSLVLAVGRGFSGALVAAAGVVSSVSADPPVIRTDVTPYGGFAGGALIDGDGRVTGIVTGGRLRGLAAAVPAAHAWKVAGTLGEHGRIRRGYLGISSHPVRIPERQRAGRPAERGLLIAGIGSGTPADEAGLLVGDVLVEFDGRPVSHPEQLLRLLSGDLVGKRVETGLLRGGSFQSVQVTVGDRP